MASPAEYLLLYSTTDGHTRTIMEAVAEQIKKDQPTTSCTILDLKENMSCDLTAYTKVLLGASIRYGYFSKDLLRFVQMNEGKLNAMPSAFFGVNLTARKANKRTPETNAYMRKFLALSPWQPYTAAVFAGALWYPKYTTFDRVMIQFIMRITGGETDATQEIVYTDWEAVRDFASAFARMPNTVDSAEVAARKDRAVTLHQKAAQRTNVLTGVTILGGVLVAAVVARRVRAARH